MKEVLAVQPSADGGMTVVLKDGTRIWVSGEEVESAVALRTAQRAVESLTPSGSIQFRRWYAKRRVARATAKRKEVKASC